MKNTNNTLIQSTKKIERRIDGVIFDLDGTIYLDEIALPTVVDTIAELRHRNKKVLFVSNNPLKSRQLYAEKLTQLGIPCEAGDVLTSGVVLTRYLSKFQPKLNYFVIGESFLVEQIRDCGLQVIDDLPGQDATRVMDASVIDAVIVSYDRKLDYRKLNIAFQALLNGAHFYATNPDKFCPMPGGGIPDSGATIKALEYITERKLELLFGKPSPLMLETALQHMNLPPENCMMVGDRLETDVRMGQNAGMLAAVVLSGATTLEMAGKADPPPDVVLERLSDLLRYCD